jgi:hypothetical protein
MQARSRALCRAPDTGTACIWLSWADKHGKMEGTAPMKTILILAMSLAMTGAALSQGGSGNGLGGPSDPRKRGTYMDPRNHGYVMRHQKRLYGATSGPHEITTERRSVH